MKRLKTILALSLAALILTGCVKKPIEQSPEPSDTPSEIPIEEPKQTFPGGPVGEQTSTNYSFVEAVEHSDTSVIAEFVSYSILDRSTAEYVFDVREVIRGETEKTIRIFELHINVNMSGYSYVKGTDKFTVGREYVLILERHDSLFEDFPTYGSSADIYIPADDIGSGRVNGELISEQFDGDIIAYIREAPPNERPVWHTKSEDIAEVIGFSDIVMEVTITEKAYTGRGYSIEVISVLEGEMPHKMGDGNVWINFVEGSVEIDGHYLVMVKEVDPPSVVYTQSSLRSVISMEDTEAVAEVMRILEG